MQASELTAGRATAPGTRRFADRTSAALGGLPGHYRRPDALWLSSLALGMRSGEPGGADDLLYRSAVPQCLEGGVNVFVTGLSERMQASERNLGSALRRALRDGAIARDEVVVVTRGGLLSVDPDLVRTRAEARRYLVETYVESGLVDPARVASGVHCFDPPFLRDQIARSRRNLGLETLDLYLLEEPELQLAHAGREGFRRVLCAAFETLECEVAAGRIGAYGLATWEGFLRPRDDRQHLALLDLFDWALEVGGGDHHLRAIQLPYGIAAAAAGRVANQLAAAEGTQSLLHALRETGTAVLASAPLLQGRALGRLPRFVREAFPGLRSDAQRCLQFARSTPGVSCAVVGMRDPEHIDENLALARVPPSPAETLEALFERGDRSEDQPSG